MKINQNNVKTKNKFNDYIKLKRLFGNCTVASN
jgi:hypothetical protein